LPLWLEVARVTCPAGLKNYKVVFKTSSGVTLKSKIITAPIARRGNIFISFCRDVEPQYACKQFLICRLDYSGTDEVISKVATKPARVQPGMHKIHK